MTLKTIKELAIEELSERGEGYLKALKDVLGLIDKKILAHKMILKRKYNHDTSAKFMKRNAGHEAVIKALEELKKRIEGVQE